MRHSLAMPILATIFTDDLTAWATAAAGIGTFGTLAFTLYQLRDERNRHRAGEKLGQAQKISGWIGSDWMHQTEATETQRIELLNASGEPVYRAVVHLVFIQGGPGTGREMDEQHRGRFRQALLVIPPGRYYVEVPPAFHHMHKATRRGACVHRPRRRSLAAMLGWSLGGNQASADRLLRPCSADRLGEPRGSGTASTRSGVGSSRRQLKICAPPAAGRPGGDAEPGFAEHSQMIADEASRLARSKRLRSPTSGGRWRRG